MARKSRRRASATTVDSSPRVEASASARNGPYLLWSGYEAANNSPARGMLWWPTTDTRRELPPLAADEIRRRVHWLVANFGFARRLVFGMAKLVGTLTPQPDSDDEAWNEEAFDHFQEHAGSPEHFDVAGKFDFWAAQRQINRNFYKDGDSLSILSEGPTGGARLAFYEAHQIRNRALRPQDGDAQFDAGVQADRFGKHQRYSLRDGQDPDKWAIVDARDCLYYGNFETHGQIRGISVLAHAVTHMHDVVETRGFTKHAIKAHSRLGTVVEQDMGTVVQMPGGGFAGGLLQTDVKDLAGQTHKIDWEAVFAGGITPHLKPGQRVKVVADDRPSFNTMEFEKNLLRDCVWGVDLPYEALCEIAGLTGPGVRYVMSEIKQWVLNEQYRLAKWCHRVWTYSTAKEIKAGRLREPSDPRWWRKVAWIGQPDPTIDRGREGQLSVIQLDTGLTTWMDEWGEDGAFWKRKLRQRVREVAWVRAEAAKAGLTYGDIFPGKRLAKEEIAVQEALRAGDEGAQDSSNEDDAFTDVSAE